jgi:ketol-acid reductoisomerase
MMRSIPRTSVVNINKMCVRTLATQVRTNYFNRLPMSEQLVQLGQCRFMDRSEFSDGINALEGKKVVIVGCGAQGLHQGLNMRDSGCDVSYVPVLLHGN